VILRVAASESGTAQTNIRKSVGVVGQTFRKTKIVERAGRPIQRG
jgi:hypothetical protein